MMYIEHNPLERQEILRNHVPSSTTAILLAHVQEEVESTLEPQSQANSYFQGELHLHNNNSIEEFTTKHTTAIQRKDVHESSATIETSINGIGAHSAINTISDAENIEEEFELLEVYDNEVNESNPLKTIKEELTRKGEDSEDILVELDDGGDVFEYVIVPKHSYNKESDETKFVNKTRRPIPPSIPIQNFEHTDRRKAVKYNRDNSRTDGVRLLNRCWPKCNNNSSSVTSFDKSDCSCSYPSHHEAGDYDETEKGLQMDIINKVRQLLSLNYYKVNTQEQSRKRKPLDLPSPRHIKYRKVDNNFPYYIPSTDYEADLTPNTNTFSHNNLPQLKPKFIYSNESESIMPQRRSFKLIDDTPKLRKSLFVQPQTTHQLVKNETYADLEFSDDDEPQLIRGFGEPSDMTDPSRLMQTYRLPVRQCEGDNAKGASKKPPPPPLLEARSAHLAGMTNTAGIYKPTYAETLKQNPHAATSSIPIVHTFNENSIKHPLSSSGSSTGASTREFAAYGQRMPQHIWEVNAHSILMQERETEERDKYQKLLEQMIPRLYGGDEKVQSKKKSNFIDLSSHALHNSSVNGSSYIFGRNKRDQIVKRPPLSSTINVDDDDNDVILTSVTPRRQKCGVPTVIVDDDDDISDIIDLAADDGNGMMSCSSKHKENSAFSLNTICNKNHVEKNKLPYVEPVNSLKERIKSSPHLKDNWLQAFQTDWERKHKHRQQEVSEALKVVEKLSTERKAAETELHEHLRKFQIVDPDILVIDDFLEPALDEELDVIEFSDQQRARIQSAIYGSQDQVLISKFGLNITRRDIATLLGHNWLNDEVINFYMNLLTERGEQKHDSHGMPLVYAMNTFFVPRLMQAGYSGVKRWTRKVDIFTKDIIPVPVHVGGVHWCMAIIHLRNRTIKYYDSMGVANPSVLKALEQYLSDESMDKRKVPFDTNQFDIESVRDVPRQMNGSDCGVFSCMFAEYVTRNRPITFSQANMEYFRHKMILEIVQGELMR